MAVEKIRSLGGGRICLGPGVFLLRSTLQLDGLKLLVLSGQGPATALVFAGDGPALAAQNDLGLRIEDLNVLALAAPSSDTNTGFINASAAAPVAVGILLRNCVETAIERCAVFAISATAANTPATGAGTFTPSAPATISSFRLGSVALALDGFLLETLIRDNVLSADIGLGEANLIPSFRDVRNVMVVIDLEVVGNLFPCNTAGVAFAEIGAASKRSEQLNLFLLETAFRENRLLGCALAGIGVEGVSLPDAAIRIADNHIDVTGLGIVCGADNAEIADNLVTQAMSAAAGGAVALPQVTGISITSVPGGKLPITEARVLRNRINSYPGNGISVNGFVLISSINGNSIMNVAGIGIEVAGPQVPSEVMVRDNEIFAVAAHSAASANALPVSGPATTGASLGQEISFTAIKRPPFTPATGIQVSQTTTATIENNSVALIGNGGTTGAIGISTANAATAAIIGNDISDIGPPNPGGNGTSYGISVLADTVGVVNVANNLVRQTTSGAKAQLPFMGVLIGPNIEPDSPDGFTGTAVVNGNMIFGNDAYLVNTIVADCILSGNLCDLAATLPSDPSAAVMAAFGVTCIASNNRVLSPGKLIGLSVSVASVKESAKATVVGNIVSTAIQLNGSALPAPWAPLNVIA
jgi:hypothetical protein